MVLRRSPVIIEFDFFKDIEMPIQRVLLKMELDGFPVDLQKMHYASAELQDTLKMLEKCIHRSCGRSFNIKSKTEKAKVSKSLTSQEKNRRKASYD